VATEAHAGLPGAQTRLLGADFTAIFHVIFCANLSQLGINCDKNAPVLTSRAACIKPGAGYFFCLLPATRRVINSLRPHLSHRGPSLHAAYVPVFSVCHTGLRNVMTT